MNALLIAVALVVAYLLGSIPFGLLFVRLATGKDVRQIGSGRTGGTNVLRAAGLGIALLSVLGDLIKGWLAVWLTHFLVRIPLVEALAGVMAVVGHNYPIFIRFKGGAGTATTIGGAVALWPWSGLVLVLLGACIICATRYASVGSITIAAVLPIIYTLRAWLGNDPWGYLVHGLVTAALTLWALRPNIQRLRDGNERRVTFRRQSRPV